MKKCLKIILLILLLNLCGGLAAQVGELCPAFSLARVNGGAYDLNSVLGKKVLLIWLTNFDEYSCENLPKLISLYHKFEPKAEFVIVYLNGKESKVPQKIAQDYQIPFPVLLDPEKIACQKLNEVCLTGMIPLNNLFLVGKDKKIFLTDHFPGFPVKNLENNLKEKN